jgi:hypothetical protein
MATVLGKQRLYRGAGAGAEELQAAGQRKEGNQDDGAFPAAEAQGVWRCLREEGTIERLS